MVSLRSSLEPGSYTPVVTPFVDGDLDLEGFELLIDRQIAGGSAGVVITGTSGEPTSLSVTERMALYTRAVQVGGGRLRVIAATGALDHRDTTALTAAATKAGVDAVMVVAPGFVQPNQRGLVDYFTAVASGTDLPVVLYNIPGRAGVAIESQTVAAVVEQRPNVIGVKHASDQLDYITSLLLELGEDFHIFCGRESLSYPMLALGGSGLMSAVGNLFPRKLTALCKAVKGGDHQTALRLHRDLFEVNRAVFFDTNPVPVKAMLAMAGLGNGEVRLPLVQLDTETHERVRRALASCEPERTEPALV